MQKINLENIRRENIKAVFLALVNNEPASRSDLSKITGLSLMTVGKIVDLFIKNKFAVQEKTAAAHAGRRPGVVRLAAELYIPIIDMSKKNFSLTLLNKRLEVEDRFECEYNTALLFIENYKFFMNSFKKHIEKKYDLSECMGVGIALPGFYSIKKNLVISSRIPELASLDFKNEILDVISGKPIVTDSDMRLAALGAIEKIENNDKKTIAYLSITDTVGCSVIIDKKMFYGANLQAGRFGDIPYSGQTTLGEFICSAANPKDIIEPLSVLLKSVICAYDPHTIILDFEKFDFSSVFIENLSSKLAALSKICGAIPPEIIVSHDRDSLIRQGLADKVRLRWLEKYFE